MGSLGIKKGVFLAALAGIVVSGCAKGDGNVSLETAALSESQEETSLDIQIPAVPEEPADDLLEETGSKFKEALENFSYTTACSLLKDGNNNEFYSPCGLYFTLAAAASGAEGNTQEQMLKLLGYGTEEELAQDCRNAFFDLYEEQDRYKLKIASSLWASHDVKLKDNFLEHVSQCYGMEAYQKELGTPEAWEAMSQWVSDRTGGVIRPVISPDSSQLLSLINTICCYDEWAEQFPAEATGEGVFTCADQTEVICDFMSQTVGSYGFFKEDNCAIASLRTKHGDMIFLLPDKGVDIHEFLKSPEILSEAFEQEMSAAKVVWRLPKFSYSSSYKMADMLKSLEMTDAFSSDAADFSSMAEEHLWIGNVNQDTHVGIDENGIEAVSFTRIDYESGGEPDRQAEMILDRPFIYMIRNFDYILFIGICQDPSGKVTASGMQGTAVEVAEPGLNPAGNPETADSIMSEPGKVVILGQEPVPGETKEGELRPQQGVGPQ